MADKDDEKVVNLTLPTGTVVTVPASEAESLKAAAAAKGSK